MHTHIHTTHPHTDKAFGEGRSDMGRHGIMYSAKPGNGHTSGHTGIHTLGGEAGGGRQSCRHAATCIHT